MTDTPTPTKPASRAAGSSVPPAGTGQKPTPPLNRAARQARAGDSFTLPISGRRIAIALVAGVLAMIPVLINENGKPASFIASAELFLPTSGVNPSTTAAYFDDFDATMFSSQGLLKDVADLNARNNTMLTPFDLKEMMLLERLGQGTAVRLTVIDQDQGLLEDLVPNAIRRTLEEVEGRDVQETEIELNSARADYAAALEIYNEIQSEVNAFDPVSEYNRLRVRADSLEVDALRFDLDGLTGAASSLRSQAAEARERADRLEPQLGPFLAASARLDRLEIELESVEDEHKQRTAKLDAVVDLSRLSPTLIVEQSKFPVMVRNGGAAAAVAAMLVLLLGTALDASRQRKEQ